MAGANRETLRAGEPGWQFSFSTFFVCTKKVESSLDAPFGGGTIDRHFDNPVACPPTPCAVVSHCLESIMTFRSIALAFIAVVSFSISNPVSAQGNLGSHHSESILNFPTGQGIVYLPIPRPGWPVRVEISGVYMTASMSTFVATSFTIADSLQGPPALTIPTTTVLDPSVSCITTSNPDRFYECFVLSGSMSIGVADLVSNFPHQMFVSINIGTSSQLRISMWY